MIETDRLILRPWEDSDAEALFRYASDPDVGPRAGWPPHKDIEESRRVIRDIFTNDRTWAVTLRETGEAIGCMGYFIHGESNIPIGEEDAEIGYWIAKPYWNRGIATEALRAMIDYCFNVKGFLTLWSDFFIDNPASGRVMEKCGFKDTRENKWFSLILKSREGLIPLSLYFRENQKKHTYRWKETNVLSTKARQWKWCFCSRTVQCFSPASPEHQPRASMKRIISGNR